MKNVTAALIIILVFSIVAACGSDDPPIIINPPPIINTPDPVPDPITYSLLVYDSNSAGFSNGTVYQHWTDGNIVSVGPSMIAVNDVIHTVNTFGNTVSTIQLPAIPSAVAISGPNIWTFETIPPVYAAANGGMSKEYTRIWLNYAEQGSWLGNQWTATRAVNTASGDVVAYDTLNRAYAITGNVTVHYSAQDGILIHTVDTVTRTGKVRTASGNFNISWSTNYFSGASQWLEVDGVWYSWNGYKWTAAEGLQEQSSVLTDFINWSNPVVIAAGMRINASLERGYWIEANTGWLWMHTPEMVKLEQVIRLYVADGNRNTGINYAAVMDPRIIDGVLYYVFEDQTWRYDFTSGINGPFMAGKSVRAL